MVTRTMYRHNPYHSCPPALVLLSRADASQYRCDACCAVLRAPPRNMAANSTVSGAKKVPLLSTPMMSLRVLPIVLAIVL